MDADLDTLCTVVYCTADDLLPRAAANARRVKAGRKVVHLRRSKSGPPFWCLRVRCDPEQRHDHRKGRITLLLEQQRDSGRS